MPCVGNPVKAARGVVTRNPEVTSVCVARVTMRFAVCRRGELVARVGYAICRFAANTGCSEVCTETADQINICWSGLSDPLAKLNATAVNQTAHSLSLAQPSASSYPVSLDALQKLTSTTAATSTTATSSSTASSTLVLSSSTGAPVATPSVTSSVVEKSDSGLSGGAIGGIVGGVVGGLALLGIVGLLVWRRRRNQGNSYAPANSSDMAPSAYGSEAPAEMHAETAVLEKYARNGGSVAEVPAEGILAELSAVEPSHRR